VLRTVGQQRIDPEDMAFLNASMFRKIGSLGAGSFEEVETKFGLLVRKLSFAFHS
jgi:hypothetical protein